MYDEAFPGDRRIGQAEVETLFRLLERAPHEYFISMFNIEHYGVLPTEVRDRYWELLREAITSEGRRTDVLRVALEWDHFGDVDRAGIALAELVDKPGERHLAESILPILSGVPLEALLPRLDRIVCEWPELTAAAVSLLRDGPDSERAVRRYLDRHPALTTLGAALQQERA
ncbi:MAG: hypothetical protein JWO69_1664 [Thermoleophilia bacterium]|nr:hypothetical protein [Thermoleophilia bacterium]